MATVAELESLACKIVGRGVKVRTGEVPQTDGQTIFLEDPEAVWPALPWAAKDDIGRVLAAHEASHVVVFDREAKKRGLQSLTAEEFYRIFADPIAPGVDSRDYVRRMLNMVEDRLVDGHAAKFVGQARVERVNRFFVWNRQGGRRPSIAELESCGNAGKCAAFIEAIFQLLDFGQLLESFYSDKLGACAAEAVKAIELFGQGALSRTQALERVLDALRKYCPPPWQLPQGYQPPKGGGSQDAQGQGGSGSGDGEDEGSAEGEGQGSGRKGKGSKGGKGKPSKGQPSDAEGDGAEGEDGEAGEDEPEEGKPSKGKVGQGDEGDSDPEKGEEYSESDGSGQGATDGSQSRGTGIGEGPGELRQVAPAPERTFEDNNLEALLRMLERVLAERSREAGRGVPRFKTWSPGDQISSPDEIGRYWEDESFGIDPLQRRCVRRRDQKRHLLAVFIDSSGSVEDKLFAQLYKVLAELAGKVADLEGCYFGVGQFSGGASWVMEPTCDVSKIRQLAEELAVRLYSGGTTVGEIYGLLPEWFAGYQTADLVVLTDGYVEDGKSLAKSLETSHAETACEIKLHGVVFKKHGSTKQLEKAKDELPQFVRVWHLGGE